jgi:hypothetical protein
MMHFQCGGIAMRINNSVHSFAFAILVIFVMPKTAKSADVLDQYMGCWSKAAVANLNATSYKSEEEAVNAVGQSIDYADERCVKLAKKVWRTLGETEWTNTHNYIVTSFSNANLQAYGR